MIDMIDAVLLTGLAFGQDYCDKYGIQDSPIQPRGAEDPELQKSI